MKENVERCRSKRIDVLRFLFFFSQKRSHAPTHTLWDIIQGVIRHKIFPQMLNDIHDI